MALFSPYRMPFLLGGNSTGQMGCLVIFGPKQNGFECAEDPHQVGGKCDQNIKRKKKERDCGSFYQSLLLSCISLSELHFTIRNTNILFTVYTCISLYIFFFKKGFIGQKKRKCSFYNKNENSSSIRPTVGFGHN